MSTLYGNLWSALAGYIQSWMLPSTFGVGFFAVALLPHVEDQSPWSGLADARSADGALLFASATLVVSFALAVSARPFVRFLEGYTLRPRWLRDRWTASQQASRKSLRQKITPTRSPEEMSRLLRELNGFPRDPEWVLPTRLGNALRAGERYGNSQYGLSTLGLWTRLVAVVDDKVTNQLARSKAILDFFVALMALSGALAIVTAVIAGWAGEPLVLLWLLPLLGLLPFWYGRAVAACGWYAQAMHALVDLGRVPLAKQLGLHLPADLDAERHLWNAVSDYAAWGPKWGDTPTWIARIDQARIPPGPDAARSEQDSDAEAGG